jgi:hypothetical protein
MIAQAVQHHLLTGQNKPPLLPPPANIESIEAVALTKTETSIRVKTTDKGTRYFTVKVSETW